MAHKIKLERDGVRYWFWQCSCGAAGASHTTPYAARQAAARYHIPKRNTEEV